MSETKPVVVVLKTGKADNGKNATLAFSCALASVALGNPTTVFLTSDAAVWGYAGSSSGIVVQGFAPLEELIEQFVESGGEILLCSVCYRTCSAGFTIDEAQLAKLPHVTLAGFTSMLEIATRGVCVSF